MKCNRHLISSGNSKQKLPEYNPAVMVGHQLMDLLKMQPEAAGFVLHDLQGKGMGIADCEQRIKAWADEHKKSGSCVCVPPDTAEQIIKILRDNGPGRKETACFGAGDQPCRLL